MTTKPTPASAPPPSPPRMRVIARAAVYIPNGVSFEPGLTYVLDASLALELIARGVVEPYADCLDGDQPTVHVVNVEDSFDLADKVGG